MTPSANPATSRRLAAVAHAEADRDRQAGGLPDPADQPGGLAADRVAGAGDAHQRRRVDEAAAGLR